MYAKYTTLITIRDSASLVSSADSGGVDPVPGVWQARRGWRAPPQRIRVHPWSIQRGLLDSRNLGTARVSFRIIGFPLAVAILRSTLDFLLSMPRIQMQHDVAGREARRRSLG